MKINWGLMLGVLIGIQCIGYIIMPVFSDPFQYYITAYAFGFLWALVIMNNNNRLR